VDGPAGGLADEVPERQLDAADGLSDQPDGPLSAPQPGEHALHEDGRLSWILADDKASQRFAHDGAGHAGILTAPTVADFTPAHEAIVGLGAHETVRQEASPQRMRRAAGRWPQRHAERQGVQVDDAHQPTTAGAAGPSCAR